MAASQQSDCNVVLYIVIGVLSVLYMVTLAILLKTGIIQSKCKGYKVCPNGDDSEANYIIREQGSDNLNELQTQNITLQNKIENLRRRNDESQQNLKEERKNSEKLFKKLEETNIKLAAEMSNKVSANESSLENVAIINRPKNVAENYELFCSETWLDAKTCLDKLSDKTEEDKITLLCDILLCAAEVTKNCQENVFDTIREPMKKLVDKEKTRSDLTLTTDVIIVVGDYLRETAQKLEPKVLEEAVISKLKERSKLFGLWQSVQNDSTMQKYLNAAILNTWNMAIQRPSMTFQLCKDWTQDHKKCWELHWNSCNPDNLHPQTALFPITVQPCLYHDKQLMAKGRVTIFLQDISK